MLSSMHKLHWLKLDLELGLDDEILIKAEISHDEYVDALEVSSKPSVVVKSPMN